MKDIQSEQFIVVNEQDEIVGYKSRYECHHNKSIIHRCTDVALFNTKGKIALQKRSMNKDLYPGYYCITASGHVSKGESYEEAAYRELEEEMGVKGVVLKKQETFMVYNETETEMTTLFVGNYDGIFTYPADEVECIQYFSQEEVKTMPTTINCSIESLKRLRWPQK
jgi:isopentenyl-diphosphate delta-isomerase type 1